MIGQFRTVAVAVTATALLTLTGCGIDVSSPSNVPVEVGATDSPGGAAAPATTDTDTDPAPDAATPRPTDGGDSTSVRDSGTIPDVCTLLSEAEVSRLTDRKITQVDKDGAKAGDATRYCQWQQASGQLAVFLSRTTQADFDVKSAEAEPVGGVGDDAFQLSGHLMVLHGTVLVDVYVRGGSDAENLVVAKEITGVLLPRI